MTRLVFVPMAQELANLDEAQDWGPAEEAKFAKLKRWEAFQRSLGNMMPWLGIHGTVLVPLATAWRHSLNTYGHALANAAFRRELDED